jgi:hypothetical protein
MHQDPVQQHKPASPESASPESEGKGKSLTPPTFQLKAAEGPAAPPPAQLKQSSGGMPTDLVQGFAASTGHDLSDVNVVRNSDKPAQVGALAYAQGNDIHLAAGQDQHLAHEAAHIVQQREGRVQANTEVNGKPVNTQQSLESEADTMGAKATQMKADGHAALQAKFATNPVSDVAQRYTQPIVASAPKTAMTITKFIELVEAEEKKYPAKEQTNTSLMITRLRKIFYGSKAWDEHLIKGVDDVKSPYGEPKERERSRKTVDPWGPFNSFDMVDKETYPVDSKGAKPEIYKNQEVALETGSHKGIFNDIGHVFAGLDAFNHRGQVDASSLATISIDNVEGVTWVGDLGSVLAEAQIQYVNSGNKLTDAEMQKHINEYAPAQDMLGNIDAYAIADGYNIGSTSGLKVSAILRKFYLGEGGDKKQDTRYTVFCKGIGLTGWDGSKFNNEEARISHYTDAVNDSAAMYIGAGGDGWLFKRLAAVGMSMNSGSEGLVRAFFKSLKTARSTEPV